MQPYVFPYLGYFQLIRATDRFVFYDDVQFMKGGWVNRNRITNQGRPQVFTLPAQGGSMHSRIMDVTCGGTAKFRKKFLRQLEQEYRRAPQFGPVSEMVARVLDGPHEGNMAQIAMASVTAVMELLDLPFDPCVSSRDYPREGDLKGPARVISITHALGGDRYVNLPGGVALYDHEQFAQAGIDLRFVRDRSGAYPQFADPFIPRLSILDVLMHNDREAVLALLDQHALLSAEALRAEVAADETTETEDPR